MHFLLVVYIYLQAQELVLGRVGRPSARKLMVQRKVQVFSESGRAHKLESVGVVVERVVLQHGRDKCWFLFAPLVTGHFGM